MCDPALGFAVGGTLLNFYQQNQFAGQAAKYKSRVAQATSDAAVEDAVNQYSQLNRRTVEERRAASERIMQIVRDAAKARGDATASTLASGVDGEVLNATLRDYALQESTRVNVVRNDRTSILQSIQDQQDAVAAQAERTIAQSIGTPEQRPSPFAALIQIGTAIADYQTRNTTP